MPPFIMSFEEQYKTTCYAGGIKRAEALSKKKKPSCDIIAVSNC